MRYVVTVHGIGQQRKNQTVLPVIERFAEARRSARAELGHPLTLGNLASHLREAPEGSFEEGLEERWIEFDRIPLSPEPVGERFVGRGAVRPRAGENIRFVDLHWSSVMDGQFDAFGMDTESWTRSVVDRLENRDAPPWIMDLVYTLRSGLLPVQKLLSRKWPGKSEEIFDRFLGDVQLYGEYRATRGMAVRRFHERMAGLHAAHDDDDLEPRFTVIAHSLGSIMSFDALLLAHMKPSIADATREALLPEYDRNPSTKNRDDAPLPRLDWINNVDSLVTLGSPIDKFLVLFWLNYEHLVPEVPDWVDRSRLAENGRIRHYNYCDELDPVGHELDVAYSPGSVVGRIFERKEDVILSRYAVPGVAHNKYWKDQDLFRRILDLAVDGKEEEEGAKVRWFKPGAFVGGLFWSYLAVPLVGWIVVTTSFLWAMFQAEAWSTRVLGLTISVGALVGSCWLMKLLVTWRRLLAYRRAAAATQHKRSIGRLVVDLALRVTVTALPFLMLLGVLGSGVAFFGAAGGESVAHQVVLYASKAVMALARGLNQAFVGWQHFLAQLDSVWLWFSNKPPADETYVALDPSRTLLAIGVGFLFAFVLTLWNWLFSVPWRTFGGDPPRTTFEEYLRADPSRPRERRLYGDEEHQLDD